uniref:Uncharacterized protein n=1 Tax=Nelumbo nucifera TaxID=4432 RepID=A0A822XIZ2_NELNU|nr:TPA_asm: hypothetical protein HUJ06_022947 [Nelumbo nucifera]
MCDIDDPSSGFKHSFQGGGSSEEFKGNAGIVNKALCWNPLGEELLGAVM